MFLEKIIFGYPILDRKFDFNKDELTTLETIARVTNQLNNVIDVINDWQGQLDNHETSDDITNKRKLSSVGNFTGLLSGRLSSVVLDQIDGNKDKLLYLVSQFADGQTGLVIDGGFFEDTGINKNYNGGVF